MFLRRPYFTSSIYNAGKSYMDRILATNPTVYYPMNDAVGSPTVIDRSGNGYHGTPNNVTFGVDGIGDGETAVEGTAVTSAVLVPAGGISAVGYTEVSGLLWCYVPILGTTVDIIFLNDSVNSNGFLYRLPPGLSSITFRWSQVGGTTGALWTLPSGTTSQWASLAFRASLSGNTARPYYNGTAIESAKTFTPAPAWGGLNIMNAGGRAASGLGLSSGYMAHFALWNSAIAESTLQELSVL